MAFSRIRRAVLFALLAFSADVLAAKAEAIGELDAADLPSSLSGSYLAGRSADQSNDVDAALAYLTYALEADPGNPALSERVLMLRLAAGEIEPAIELAEKLVIGDNRNPTARMALAASALKVGRFDLAQSELKETLNSPLATLTAGLLSAWAEQGMGRTDEALQTVDKLTGPAWYGIFKDYHHALIADAAGRKAEAEEAITKAYDTDGTALRIVEAYARISARSGHRDRALRALSETVSAQSGHPVIKELAAQLESSEVPVPIASTAQSGAAEVLYGLGSAIGTDEGASLAAGYLQLAHYLDPKMSLVTVALGDIFQAANQCEKAIQIYGKVTEASPLWRNAAIQTGNCLDVLGRTDDGAKAIRKVVDADPKDVEAAIALGNLYRAHDRFAEAADAFTIGVEAISEETNPDWRIYYFRGVSFERTKRWPQAEADFKLALKVNPNQPQVLNYLGYSWVDMGVNLEEALNMIRTAVDLRPNDGYIVDSLGWAYYRLGRYEDATEHLERAVELRPEDAVINDHLGDSYWRVGRKREALFQWAHARDLKPEEAELEKILGKIRNGLDDAAPKEVPKVETPAVPPAVPPETKVSAVNPADGAKAPSSVTVEIGDSLSAIAERVYGDQGQYLRIFDANKDRIDNPDIIYPGMTLTIPAQGAN
jgi:Flp pilus assembly protein TadD/LysM repeat protein